MSIWGRRVDELFTRGRPATTREDYNNAGKNALWQVALVALLVLIALVALGLG